VSTAAYATLVGKTLTTDVPNIIDFNTMVENVTFQILATGTVTAGTVTLQVSVDGKTWFSPPTAAFTNQSAATLANPYVLVTSTNALFSLTGLAVRYAQVIISANVTGGATVSAYVSASGA
jgi:hypothetical protein